MAAFDRVGLLPEIIRAVEDMDWLLPTDVQAEAIPLILGGGDVLMAAETGSGKTGAFCLPVIQIVQETRSAAPRAQGRGSHKPASAAQKRPDVARMNVYDRDSGFAVSPDGLLSQSRDQRNWEGGRATVGAIKGKHYFEATVTDEGLCRVGYSLIQAHRNLGTDRLGYGFGGTGKKSFGRQFDDYGEAFGLNDVIGCFLDLDAGTLHWSKNGVVFVTAYTIPPELRGKPLHPAVVLKNAEMRFNFGDAPFKHPPAGGFAAIAKQPADCVVYSMEAPLSVAAAKGDASKKPLAIILEPSRELAEQTMNQITLFKKHLPAPGVSETLLIGGTSAKDSIKALQKGVDIVVGTPGRIEDFVKTNKLDLSQIRFFILDEADGLLSAGHGKLLDMLYQRIPKESPDGKRLQMVVCSATLHSPEVKKLAEAMMHFPTWVDLKGQDSVPDTVHQCVAMIDPVKDASWHQPAYTCHTDAIHQNIKPGQQSDEALSQGIKILKYKYVLNAINTHDMEQAIIFCRTKLDCDNLERFLLEQGGGARAMVNRYSCACMHSDRQVKVRRANLEAFKNGETRFLICTDVAARGIDVRGIPYVINMTLPDEKETFVHRIGRVGRADRMGLAISLCATVKEKVWYHTCPSRGKGCRNTKLVANGGCTIWYNEPQYIQDIQEHLGVVIPTVEPDMAVPRDEFDGKVIYGEKRAGAGTEYKGHADILAPSVQSLADLEHRAQLSFHNLKLRQW